MRLQSLLRSFAAAALLCTTMAGAPAQAASVTYTDATCLAFSSSAGTNAGDLNITCSSRAGVTCQIASTLGLTVPLLSATTLNASCNPAATAGITWAPGASQPANCPTLLSTSGNSQNLGAGASQLAVSGCVYNIVGDAGASGTGNGTITLAWSNVVITGAPTGCTVSVTGSPVPASGGNATLTIDNNSCANIDGNTTYNWYVTGSNTSLGSGQSYLKNYLTNAGAQINDSYSLKACNGASCKTVTKPVVQTAGIGGGGGGTGGTLGLCNGKNVIQADITRGGQFFSRDVGGLPDNGIFVGAYKVPAVPTLGSGSVSVAEFQSGSASRQITISSEPCDFRPLTNYPANLTGPLSSKAKGNTFFQGYTLLQSTAGTTLNPKLVAGNTYYVNVRNLDNQGAPMQGGSPTQYFDILLTINGAN